MIRFLRRQLRISSRAFANGFGWGLGYVTGPTWWLHWLGLPK